MEKAKLDAERDKRQRLIDKLQKGNHDTANIHTYLKYFTKVYSVLESKGEGILLSHYPVHPSQLEYRYKHNVHGHMHSAVIPDKRYLNISCEHTNLAPISHDEVIQAIQHNAEVGHE